MFGVDEVAGRWTDLVDRLDRAGTVARWAGREPALAGVGGVQGLADLTARGAEAGRADEVLGSLVRLAAQDGGDDPDAVLVLVHLLARGVHALANKLCDLDPSGDIVTVVAGQLVAEIRAFPWQRRHRAIAANLLLDTRRRVLHDYGVRRGAVREVPVTDDVLRWWIGLTESQIPVDDDSTALERLGDLLEWAALRQVADVEDLQLLWRIEQLAGYGKSACERVAADLGTCSRTIRRRRQSTLAALRAAAPAYQAA